MLTESNGPPSSPPSPVAEAINDAREYFASAPPEAQRISTVNSGPGVAHWSMDLLVETCATFGNLFIYTILALL